MSKSAGGGKVLTTCRSRRKRTWGVIRNAEEFEGVRTPPSRHQIHYRIDVFGVTLDRDLGEVETIWEVQ